MVATEVTEEVMEEVMEEVKEEVTEEVTGMRLELFCLQSSPLGPS